MKQASIKCQYNLCLPIYTILKYRSPIIDILKRIVFIPDFKYELINLNNISFEELQSHQDLLSALFIIDKIKRPADLKKIESIKCEYWDKLKENVSSRKELEKIAEAMKLLLSRINTPEEEIKEIIENIYEGRLEKMFEMAVHYDVQETRAIAREEGMKEEKLKVARNSLKQGIDIKTISAITGLSVEEIGKLASSPIKES